VTGPPWVAQKEPVPASASPDDATADLFWDVHDVDGSHLLIQARLLDNPSGWGQQITKPGMLLSDFREDRTYSVWGGTSNPSAGIASHVGFILADLRSLAPDQVWAAPEPLHEAQAMSRTDFRKQAAASC